MYFNYLPERVVDNLKHKKAHNLFWQTFERRQMPITPVADPGFHVGRGENRTL